MSHLNLFETKKSQWRACDSWSRFLIIFFCGWISAESTVAAPATHTQMIPIPVYATLPNEGSTFGLMPVFLKVQDESKEVESILAPSVSYNEVIRFTGTFRWFQYPSPVKNRSLILSASTRTNWNGLYTWQDLPTEPEAKTEEVALRVERSIFYRLFGIGPDSRAENESSYTRLREVASDRLGINLTREFNIGAHFEFENDRVEVHGVPGLPLSTEIFPAAPGMQGSTIVSELFDVRFDSRRNHEYSEQGFYADVQSGAVEGIWHSPHYWQSRAEIKALIPEKNWLTGGARFFWNYVSSPEVPFYLQSSLGGSSLLRGFTEDRFIDQGAWAFDFEQRIRIFRTAIFGVIADWRLDPFFSFGQVFPTASQAFSHVRTSFGTGFRALAEPNVLGRVDIGYGGEGIKVYVELGYPF